MRPIPVSILKLIEVAASFAARLNFESGNRWDKSALGDGRSFFRNRGAKNDDWMKKRGAQLDRFLQISYPK